MGKTSVEADFEKPMCVLYAIYLRLYVRMNPRRMYLELGGTHRQGVAASLKWRA
jgi:hypothetical protein